MLIKDESTIARIDSGDKREAHRQDISNNIEQKIAAKVTDFDLSPTNPLRQWGKAMLTYDFETKLKPILPAFCRIMPHPTNHTKRCMYIACPDGSLEFLLSWEAVHMPEHSVMHTIYEDVPDMSVGVSDDTSISRADLPPHEWMGPEEGWKFDTSKAPLAGMKRVETVGSEAIRGWRTCLLKLIYFEVITVADAERVFGADDRKEWAGKTGKQDIKTLW